MIPDCIHIGVRVGGDGYLAVHTHDGMRSVMQFLWDGAVNSQSVQKLKTILAMRAFDLTARAFFIIQPDGTECSLELSSCSHFLHRTFAQPRYALVKSVTPLIKSSSIPRIARHLAGLKLGGV